MALVIVSTAELIMCDAHTALAGKVHLYKNNYTPVAGSVLASFTAADYSGYVAQSVTFNDAVEDGTKAKGTADTLTYECASGSQTIYGYYVTKLGSDSTLLWAEKFSTARTIDSDTPLTVTPVYTYESAN